MKTNTLARNVSEDTPHNALVFAWPPESVTQPVNELQRLRETFGQRMGEIMRPAPSRAIILQYSATVVFTLVMTWLNPARAAIIWDESINGDFPRFAPYPILTLQLGTNEVLGNTGITSLTPNVSDFDRFIVSVPAGLVLTSATFSSNRTVGTVNSITWNVFDGAGVNPPLLQSFVGQVPSTNLPVLAAQVPLDTGLYLFQESQMSINSGSLPSFADYSFRFEAAAIAPEPASLAVWSLGALGIAIGAAHRGRRTIV